MNKCFVYGILITLLLPGCESPDSPAFTSSKPIKVKGEFVYGGTLKVNENEKPISFYPAAINDVFTTHIGYQIYEGLVAFYLKNGYPIKPVLAESWTIDTTGTVYTFKLKKGVFFQDDSCFVNYKGRELKAADFKYAFTLLCTYGEENNTFETIFRDKLKGANEYYEASKTGKKTTIPGITVIDDYTLQLSLYSPCSSFLSVLANIACAVVPQEAIERYGKKAMLGTGPFVLKKENIYADKLILIKNNNYHAADTLGNKLPYLDSVVVTFIPNKLKEFTLFKNKQLDVAFLVPLDSVVQMLQRQIEDFQSKSPKYTFETCPGLTSQFYGFNLAKKPFDNLKVRTAFNYAIDRERLVAYALHGNATNVGTYGVCPPIIKGYDNITLTGYNYNPEKARKLLKEAGYPDGKGFPAIHAELNLGGSVHPRVIEEMKTQLKKTLNIEINYDIVPFNTLLNDMQQGSAELFKISWVADFPDPETFLGLFYGKTVPNDLSEPSIQNTCRYKNAEFDRYFELGRSAINKTEAYANFLKAEEIMMRDSPVMVLWYEEFSQLLHANIKGLRLNSLGVRSYKEVYFGQLPVLNKK